MEGAVTAAAGDVEEAEDIAVEFPAVIEDPVGIYHPASLGAMVEEDTEVVTVEDIVEVMLRDVLMEGTTIPEDIMEVTIGTIIEDMPHLEQPLGFFSVG